MIFTAVYYTTRLHVVVLLRFATMVQQEWTDVYKYSRYAVEPGVWTRRKHIAASRKTGKRKQLANG